MDNEKRQKRAKSIAAMGLVKRDGDVFKVSTPSLRGHQTFHTVSRTTGTPKGISSRIVCDCLDFEENKADETFRCEHILAVKQALISKNTESIIPPEKRQEFADNLAKNQANDAEAGKELKDALRASNEQVKVSVVEFIEKFFSDDKELKLSRHHKAMLDVLEKNGTIRIILTRGELKKMTLNASKTYDKIF